MRISDWSSDVCSSDLHRNRFKSPQPSRNIAFQASAGAQHSKIAQSQSDRDANSDAFTAPPDSSHNPPNAHRQAPGTSYGSPHGLAETPPSPHIKGKQSTESNPLFLPEPSKLEFSKHPALPSGHFC